MRKITKSYIIQILIFSISVIAMFLLNSAAVIVMDAREDAVFVIKKAVFWNSSYKYLIVLFSLILVFCSRFVENKKPRIIFFVSAEILILGFILINFFAIVWHLTLPFYE